MDATNWRLNRRKQPFFCSVDDDQNLPIKSPGNFSRFKRENVRERKKLIIVFKSGDSVAVLGGTRHLCKNSQSVLHSQTAKHKCLGERKNARHPIYSNCTFFSKWGISPLWIIEASQIFQLCLYCTIICDQFLWSPVKVQTSNAEKFTESHCCWAPRAVEFNEVDSVRAVALVDTFVFYLNG